MYSFRGLQTTKQSKSKKLQEEATTTTTCDRPCWDDVSDMSYSFRGLQKRTKLKEQEQQEVATCDQCWDEETLMEHTEGWMECGDCECLLCDMCVEQSRICQTCDEKQRMGEKAACQYPILCSDCTQTCEDCGDSQATFCKSCMRDHELVCTNKSAEKKEMVQALSEMDVKEMEVERLKRKLQLVSNQLIKAESELEDARNRKEEAQRVIIQKKLTGTSGAAVPEANQEPSFLKVIVQQKLIGTTSATGVSEPNEEPSLLKTWFGARAG